MKRILSGFAIAAAFAFAGTAKAQGDMKDMKKDLDARIKLCGQIAELHVAEQQLAQMQSTQKMGDLKEVVRRVEKEARDVIDDAADYKKVRNEELKRANDNLKKAIDRVPNSMTIDQARQQLTPEVNAVRQAANDLHTQVNCGGGM